MVQLEREIANEIADDVFRKLQSAMQYARQTSTRKTQNAKILFNICQYTKSATI